MTFDEWFFNRFRDASIEERAAMYTNMEEAYQAGINAEKVRHGEQLPDADGKVNQSMY